MHNIFSLFYFLLFSYFGFWFFQLQQFIFQDRYFIDENGSLDFPTFCWLLQPDYSFLLENALLINIGR